MTAKNMQVFDSVKLFALDDQDQIYPVLAKNSQATALSSKKIQRLLGSVKRNGLLELLKTINVLNSKAPIMKSG
ncbi:MAG: hypothetical protein ACLTW7_15855 [Enterococcus sp.]|uniref:hypothetical protein n=1 Tax=Enterococcus sp. TaxID=35783 RepID=UPI003993ED04